MKPKSMSMSEKLDFLVQAVTLDLQKQNKCYIDLALYFCTSSLCILISSNQL